MSDAYDSALELAGELLGRPLELPLGPGQPESGREFRRLATLHTFGDSWPRTRQLDTRTRSLISIAITAALGTHEPLPDSYGSLSTTAPAKPKSSSSSSTLRHMPAPHARSTPIKSPPACSPSGREPPTLVSPTTHHESPGGRALSPRGAVLPGRRSQGQCGRGRSGPRGAGRA